MVQEHRCGLQDQTGRTWAGLESDHEEPILQGCVYSVRLREVPAARETQ